MRSKIIFFLLFMLSFVILHDSLLEKKGQTSLITQAEYPSSLSQKDTKIQEIHKMFHIVVILAQNSMPSSTFKDSKSIKSPDLKKKFYYYKTIIKPPIA